MLRVLALFLPLLLSACATTAVGTLHAFAVETPNKTILIAIDGTGNSAVSRTNAARLYEAFEATGEVVGNPLATHYSEGVGSRGSPLGLAAGVGINTDVRQAYEFLSRTYRPGDTLVFTGFSRGAYAVRILAGLIAAGGIPDTSRLARPADRERLIRDLYAVYRSPAGPCFLNTGNCPRRDRMRAIARRMNVPVHGQETGVRVRAMLIWDTVEALGLPDRTEDPTETLDRYMIGRCNVDYAFQALALHDNRAFSFTPIFMDGPTMIAACPGAESTVKDLWFSGAHADVGGSYDWKRMIDGGLPSVSYNWMIAQLKGVLGKTMPRLMDLKTVYEDVDGPIHDAREAFFGYKVLDRNYRDPINYQGKAKLPPQPRVHISALERLLVLHAIDKDSKRCPSGSSPDDGRPLLCAAEIEGSGLVKEMRDRPGCIVPSGAGWQLERGQTCIMVECRDGTTSTYYCGNEQTYAECRALLIDREAMTFPHGAQQGSATCPRTGVRSVVDTLRRAAPVSS